MRKVQPITQSNATEMPLLLDEKQAVQYLGVSLSYLRKGRTEGAPGGRTQSPSFVRVGGRVYYRRPDLDNWVSSLASQRVVGGCSE